MQLEVTAALRIQGNIMAEEHMAEEATIPVATVDLAMQLSCTECGNPNPPTLLGWRVSTVGPHRFLWVSLQCPGIKCQHRGESRILLDDRMHELPSLPLQCWQCEEHRAFRIGGPITCRSKETKIDSKLVVALTTTVELRCKGCGAARFAHIPGEPFSEGSEARPKSETNVSEEGSTSAFAEPKPRERAIATIPKKD